MADDIRKTIPQLDAGGVVSGSLFESAQPAQTSTGYASVKVTSDDIATYTNATKSYSALNTSAKQIIPAINEAASMGDVVQLTQSEYTVLTTAEKMNGSIYKLTDKAIFYCLDEEYHAVKELTTAQYDALSSAQQNNGTIYIQTDKETTGSDIAVSSGETETIAEAISELTTNITTQTSDGISWTIKRNGKFYEMWADISIDASAVTPTQWGSLYVYRNSKTTYLLPVTLAKKICDLSFSSGATATMTVYYTDLSGQENEKTSADAIRATTTTSTIVVHKYICGYVN